MATTFFFRAVASDGKVRSGSLTGDDEKLVARELRKQGLTPIYVGVAPKSASIEIKLPSFGKGTAARRPLLHAGAFHAAECRRAARSRALSITAELTERPAFRFIVLDVLRVLKGGKSLADSLATHPEYFSDLYINMVRAGEASGALAAIFERLAEFERSRDDLRNYIISSMIYPALLAVRGPGLDHPAADVRGAALRLHLHRSTMKIPLPTQIMLEASDFVTGLLVDRRRRRWRSALIVVARVHADRGGAHVVGRRAPEDCRCSATRC